MFQPPSPALTGVALSLVKERDCAEVWSLSTDLPVKHLSLSSCLEIICLVTRGNSFSAVNNWTLKWALSDFCFAQPKTQFAQLGSEGVCHTRASGWMLSEQSWCKDIPRPLVCVIAGFGDERWGTCAVRWIRDYRSGGLSTKTSSCVKLSPHVTDTYPASAVCLAPGVCLP